MDKFNETIDKINEVDNINAVSPETVRDALERSESFRGNKLSTSAEEKRFTIIALCEQYKALSPYVQYVAPPVVNTESNTFVTLIQPLPAFVESKLAKEVLAHLVSIADSVMFANSSAGLSMSFCIENIWEE